MKKKTNLLMKRVVDLCFLVAYMAAGSISYWGGYQIKESENIANILKSKNRK